MFQLMICYGKHYFGCHLKVL